MRAGDWLLYYSPTTEFGGGEPLRAFTALGRVADEQVYPFDMGGGFVPFRRGIDYLPIQREVALAEIRSRLELVRHTPNWGLLARRGHFELGLADAERIARAMGARLSDARPLRAAEK
jgi:hypothetical protein